MASELEPTIFNIPVLHPTFKLVLTGPRHSDGEASAAALNDPAVYMNLGGPPYPYTPKDWEEWYPIVADVSHHNRADMQAIMEQDRSALCSQDWSGRKWLGKKMWHSTIRDASDAETHAADGRFIGDITVQRETFVYILDDEERQRTKDENDRREPGDPRIIWMIGFWLIPQYHRRGIMPVALRTLMAEVIIPYMNAHIVHGGFLDHNLGSRKVFEKCGFIFQGVVPNAFTINPAKVNGVQGIKVGTGTTKWEWDTSS